MGATFDIYGTEDLDAVLLEACAFPDGIPSYVMHLIARAKDELKAESYRAAEQTLNLVDFVIMSSCTESIKLSPPRHHLLLN